MHRNHKPTFVLALCIIIAGCSASTGSKTALDGTKTSASTFSNLLIVGIAHDYDGRARFERSMVSQLAARGTAATAYYVAAKGNNPLTGNRSKSWSKLAAMMGS